jgi:3-hydroxyisobutyrate dehydrogenase-like beta-hydroxyacid dehydrogenase
MAGRLTEWPGGLSVYDVRAEAMQPFVDAGAVGATDLADLARTCDVISVVVLNDAQVREVVTALVADARPGTIIGLHSTIEVGTAAELAGPAAEREVQILDAPISGGPGGAAAGTLVAMIGGERSAYETAKPVFSAWAALVVHLGPAGAGTTAKLARAMLTFGTYAVIGEVQRLAEAGGIDLQKLAGIIRQSDTAMGGPTVIMVRPTAAPIPDGDPLRPFFEHGRNLGEKDLDLALTLASQLDVDLPMTELTRKTIAMAMGVPHELSEPQRHMTS